VMGRSAHLELGTDLSAALHDVPEEVAPAATDVEDRPPHPLQPAHVRAPFPRPRGKTFLTHERVFAFMKPMQLAFDAVDRLVELVEERGAVPAGEAARHLLALRQAPDALARSLIGELVAGDARLTWRGACVALSEPHSDPLLEEAQLVVFDLETTGLAAASARICEIGAVRVERLELGETFQTLVAPGVLLPQAISLLTGLRDEELSRAPRVEFAVRRFLAFAGEAT